MNRPNIAVVGCPTKSGADGQGWQQLHSSDFNPSLQPCQSPQSHAFHLLVQFMQGIPKKPAEQDVQLVFTIQPCQHSWVFEQAWRNKFGLCWEDLCQVLHPKSVLIGSPLKLFKKQYLMKTNRCITAECHCKIVNGCHHQVLIAKLKKKKKRKNIESYDREMRLL